MSETDIETARAPSAAKPDLAMRLRPEAARVTRVSRRVLAGVGLVAGLGIGGALIYALQTADRQPDRLLPTDVARSRGDANARDHLIALPNRYSITQGPSLLARFR